MGALGEGKAATRRIRHQCHCWVYPNISETRTATGIMFENMRITLHRVVNGNFHSDEIDEAAFSR
jgi:hypothetical protein